MKKKTQAIIALIGSFLVLSVGLFRILTESLTSTPLFVAYVFTVAGLMGVIINGIVLRKLQTNE
ncbi:hypothetical protein [Halalkalibacter okhensis]|uniref:Uncharacterized protein n=1 Tax=Halalkalibacter okhensis TaxID=333138 RepID=A0A0B0IDQ1_9BACI|nr:hypothetical protein [Halalkalibacter okhensis]KHF39390.1 hypothetical protein LQ50_16030 [Halalkalibacter okhensis]